MDWYQTTFLRARAQKRARGRGRGRRLREPAAASSLCGAQGLLDVVDAERYVVVKAVGERLVPIGRGVHQIFEGLQPRDLARAPVRLVRRRVGIGDDEGEG